MFQWKVIGTKIMCNLIVLAFGYECISNKAKYIPQHEHPRTEEFSP